MGEQKAAMTVTNAQRVIAANQANTIRLGITAAIMNVHRIRRSAAMTVPVVMTTPLVMTTPDQATLMSLRARMSGPRRNATSTRNLAGVLPARRSSKIAWKHVDPAAAPLA